MSMLQHVEVFFPSEIEVERLLGHNDVERAARQFAGLGCGVVAIKLGEKGVVVYDAATERFLTAPAIPATALDTTGAGDSFSGGFMAAYAQSRDIAAATDAGLVAAAFAIEDFGSSRLFEITQMQATQRLAQVRAAVSARAGAIA